MVVLHDVAQAARFADTLIVMRQGTVFNHGQPQKIVTHKMLSEVYVVSSKVFQDPVTGSPMVTIIR